MSDSKSLLSGLANRKLSGVMIEPKVQIKYALFNSIFVSFFVFMTHFLIVMKLQMIADADPSLFIENEFLFGLLDFMKRASYLVALVAFCLVFMSTMIVTHRFVGPKVAILKFIDQLIDGSAQKPLSFRKADELTDIATKLNELQSHLGSKKN